MASGRPHRSSPVIDELSRPFWEGALRRELVIQQCVHCGFLQHPPHPECARCYRSSRAFTKVSGEGVIYEAAIVCAPLVAGWESAVPYACVVIELSEQPGLLIGSNLVGAPTSFAQVGQWVVADFDHGDDGSSYLVFRLAARGAL